MSEQNSIPENDDHADNDSEHLDVPSEVDLPGDVYDQIVDQVQNLCENVSAYTQSSSSLESTSGSNVKTATAPQSENGPTAPKNLVDAGLNMSIVADLILKSLYLNGSLTGFGIAQQLRLPFSVTDEVLEFLTQERCVEVRAGEIVGRISYQFLLTDQGRERARLAFEECRYVGPAPVPLKVYAEMCRQQAVRHVDLNASKLREGFSNLIIDERLIQSIGPAVCSGLSLFLFGEPGNGKTVIARALGRLLNQNGGAIYVPYSISIDQKIVTVFDPTIHHAVVDPIHRQSSVVTSDHGEADQRWQRVLRPVVIAGGELRMDMLDLQHQHQAGFAHAPLHIKANGGVFLLDDFGRQQVPPRELLNRWILPLEEREDYLTLDTGKVFSVPFEQLIIFSTNLEPSSLVDAAFLRRIRHKIHIAAPSEQQYRDIFRRECELRDIKYDDWIVTQLFANSYNRQTPPKSSDPRDLLDVIESICRFKEQRPHLSEEVVSTAFEQCLSGLVPSE